MFGLNKIIPINSDYKFLNYRIKFYFVSGFLILLSLILLFFKGLNLGIDFKGGTLVEVNIKETTSISDLRNILSPNFNEVSLQEFGDKNTIIIRLQNDNNQESIQTVNKLKKLINNKVLEFRRSEFVGPTISSELLWKGFQAVSFALLAILVYIWLRFEWQFGFGAVVALTHDVLITLGIFSLLDYEISLAVIAAFLTIVGYSLNDTIVIFDRVRENMKSLKGSDFTSVINKSINESLSRTIVTSVTTFAVVLILFLFGGEVIHNFSFAMIIGVFVGTYSSIFIASPAVIKIAEKD